MKTKLTQKEIKQIKKDIAEYGILEQGYYCTIKNIFNFDDILQAIKELNENGYNFSNLEEYQDEILLTELINKMSYQDFKNKALSHIFH